MEDPATCTLSRAIAEVAGVVRLAFGTIDFMLDLGLPEDAEAMAIYRAELALADAERAQEEDPGGSISAMLLLRLKSLLADTEITFEADDVPRLQCISEGSA